MATSGTPLAHLVSVTWGPPNLFFPLVRAPQSIKKAPQEFPGGAVVKNPPANAGVQGTRVRALFWEDPTCHGAAKLVHHSY